jgi:hypothetical protein
MEILIKKEAVPKGDSLFFYSYFLKNFVPSIGTRTVVRFNLLSTVDRQPLTTYFCPPSSSDCLLERLLALRYHP